MHYNTTTILTCFHTFSDPFFKIKDFYFIYVYRQPETGLAAELVAGESVIDLDIRGEPGSSIRKGIYEMLLNNCSEPV